MKKSHGENVYIPDEITSVFTAPDYPFPDSENYLIAFKTEKDALNGMLPEGFQFISGYEDVVLLRVNRFESKDKKIRPYWETVISIPAIFGEGEGAIQGEYASQLYLGSLEPESNTSPTLSGQMHYGYPKREAIFNVNGEFGVNDTNIQMSRHETLLFDIDIKEKQDSAAVDPNLMGLQGNMMVFKAIPNATGNGWDVLEINMPIVKDGSFNLKDMRAVDAEFKGNLKLDSGRVIPVKEVIGSVYMKYDWILGQAELVHDYLDN